MRWTELDSTDEKKKTPVTMIIPVLRRGPDFQ